LIAWSIHLISRFAVEFSVSTVQSLTIRFWKWNVKKTFAAVICVLFCIPVYEAGEPQQEPGNDIAEHKWEACRIKNIFFVVKENKVIVIRVLKDWIASVDNHLSFASYCLFYNNDVRGMDKSDGFNGKNQTIFMQEIQWISSMKQICIWPFCQ